MKARVIETGEIIDVKRLYPTIYSRLDINHRIVEEYDDDEIELIDKPKMVSIERACKWLERNITNYRNWEYNEFHKCVEYDGGFDIEKMISDFKKAMES